MFVVHGVVDEVWVYASLALYGMALLVYWLIQAGARPGARERRDEIAEKVALALAAGQGPSTENVSEPEPEIVVEPSRTEPIVFPAMVPTAPAAYNFRGYTLYERGGSRFFSKATPPGAQAIELPPGYEATWDAKKDKPVLVEVLEPEPEVAPEVQQKPCSAMVSPGEFCENLENRDDSVVVEVDQDVTRRAGQPNATRPNVTPCGANLSIGQHPANSNWGWPAESRT